MRVRDLQEFLSKFTESKKDGSRQGNAMSDAVIMVEINGFLEEIKKMEVHENNQTIIGLHKNHQSHRLVLKTKSDRKICSSKSSSISMYRGSRIRELAACGLKLDACSLGLDACRLMLEELGA
jgi:hypothetical protein